MQAVLGLKSFLPRVFNSWLIIEQAFSLRATEEGSIYTYLRKLKTCCIGEPRVENPRQRWLVFPPNYKPI
ncbi:hypothetical protein DP923_05205 [Pontibacter arcticus]|uniref:Uncharacterized protein n=1 Tax=Pontibacter arcticus TaxID=2080288 RepID=A0A364RJG7_9BACT|nr:hypothetical protein DP923_05205 [Pontibacter arcticus]